MKNTRLIKTLLTATGILGTLGAVFLATPASAASLATSSVICSYPIMQSSSSCAANGSSATAAAGSLTVIAQASNSGGFTSNASGSAYGYFDLASSTGTFGDAFVPVLIDAYLYTNLGGGGSYNNGQAEADFGIGGDVISACSGSVINCGSKPTSLLISDYRYDVGTGNPNNIAMFVQASVGLNSDGPSTGYATADPYIRIDPVFLSTHPQYSLVFSANFTNAPIVPIPAAVWLFGSGLLGLVGVARRKVRKA
jgi:hypothetical protein